jgi:hypothetical protein
MSRAWTMIAALALLLVAAHASGMDTRTAEAQIRSLAQGRAAPLSAAELDETRRILKRSALLDAPRLDPATLDALGRLIFLADADKAFQSEMLTGERQLFQRIGMDVDAWGYANLVDRVDAKNGRPPTYGTLHAPAASPPSADRLRAVARARRYIGLPGDAAQPDATRLPDGSLPLAMRHPVYPTLPDVRAELVRLFALDQAAREFDDARLDEAGKKAAYARMERTDAQVLARFRPIFQRYGIPDNRSVGRFGTLAAWTIVQHSITAPALMRKAVADAERLHANGELADGPYALLVDRVACVIDHKPQVYGTFPVGDPKSPWHCPIENPAALDERRASVFMEPLSGEQ